jgi:type II secretory pathway component GspD/PulD (secretin)
MIIMHRYFIIIAISCLLPFSVFAQEPANKINTTPTETADSAASNPFPPTGKQSMPGGEISPAKMPQVPQQLQRRLPGQLTGPAATGLPNTPSMVHTPGSDLNITSTPQSSLPVTVNRIMTPRGSVSLNFDDADIYSVILTVFGEILRVNYIIDPKVKGRVTFRSIAPVSQEEVLPLMEVILRLNGVAIVEENNLYRIIPITDLAREPAAINLGRNAEKIHIRGKALLQVVPIEYMQSSDIVKLIAPFVSTSAVIVDIPKTNNIIIADTDANVKRLLQLINIFDSAQPKKKGPQVFVHHVQNNKAKDITAVLQQIFLGAKQADKSDKRAPSVSSSMQTSSNPADRNSPQAPSPMQTLQSPGQSGEASGVVSDLVRIYADEILNAIIILGTPEDYQIIKDTIAKLDIVPRQVLLEGAIAQIQLTDKMSLGLAWSLKTNLFGLDAVTIGLNPSQLSSDTSSTSGLSLIGIDSGNSVRAVINALASKSKAKLLASPHIMVSDNREARIQVGQQVPIVTSESYGGTAGVTTVPIRTIQYKDIGIILKVKPQINDSGLVALEISQEISTYSKDTFYANEVQIILNKTEAATNLVVQDGQTIVIGGLIREDDSKSRQGIPFLSNIPILGYLFGNTDNEALRTEIVILLTPHVVKNQQDAKAVTGKFVDKMTDEKATEEMKKGIQLKKEVESK